MLSWALKTGSAPLRLGLGRLRNLEPKPPVRRDEWERPGDLINVDVKFMARFEKAGHRITGDRQQGRSYAVGYDKVHVAVDDATRLAYVEVLAKAERLIQALCREWAYALPFRNSQGAETTQAFLRTSI